MGHSVKSFAEVQIDKGHQCCLTERLALAAGMAVACEARGDLLIIKLQQLYVVLY